MRNLGLKDEYEMHQMLKLKIEKCDKEIELLLKEIIEGNENKKHHTAVAKPHKKN